MRKFVATVFVIIMNFYFIYGTPRPAYIAACHEKDPNIDQCAIDSARKAIPELVKGDPVYNIPKMNPMHIDAIDLELSNLKLSTRNVTVKGLDTATPKNFHLDIPNRKLIFELFLPILDISGQYTLNGQLVIFPIQGNGFTNIKYINGTYVYTMHYNVIERKNRRYINTTTHNVVLDCERAYFRFDNLFNGNKVLGDQIQQFMNENWREVNSDIGPLIAQAIDSIAFYTSHSILIRVPYEDVFLP